MQIDREPVEQGHLLLSLRPNQLGRDGLEGEVARGGREVTGEVHEHTAATKLIEFFVKLFFSKDQVKVCYQISLRILLLLKI